MAQSPVLLGSGGCEVSRTGWLNIGRERSRARPSWTVGLIINLAARQPIRSTLRIGIPYWPTRDLLLETSIVQAVDFYPGKSCGQRDQRDGLEPVMRWSAEYRTANCGGDEDAALLDAQELSRCTLQLRCDPDVPAIKKGAESVERATVQPDADRAAESLLVPN